MLYRRMQEQRRMERKPGPLRRQSGFSLGEMLATVIVGGMILTAILGIYARANRAAEAVLRKIESPALASEVLQLISEDIDRALGAEDVIVQIRNGFDNGFVRAELVMRRTFHDKENKEQVLEEITWRAGYDRQGDTPGLTIYRSREGMGQEDKLLEDQREDWEKNYPFVPICRGATFFQIQAYKGEELADQWPLSAPPAGVKVTISFAEPYETVRGTRDVLDEQKISRSFVINAMRKIKFAMEGSEDPNAPDDPNRQNMNDQDGGRPSPAGGRDAAGRPTNQRTPTVPSPRGSVTNERTSTPTRRE